MFFNRKKDTNPPEPEPDPGKEEGGSEEPPGEGLGDTGSAATSQFLTGDRATDRRAMEVLFEAISDVASTPVTSDGELDSLLVKIVDLSIEVTRAERGLLLLEQPAPEGLEPDGRSTVLEVRVAREGGARCIEGEIRFSTTIARRALDANQPLRTTVMTDQEAFKGARSVIELKLRAAMCVPLPGSSDGTANATGEGKPLGALYVDSSAAQRRFRSRDLSLFAALASQISATMQKARWHLDSIEKLRLKQSLELASAIQRDLMPSTPCTLPGFEVHGWYRAAEEAAGDFYDTVSSKDGRLAVVLGDVTGHGVGPALIAASAQGGLRSYLKLLDDPAATVTLLNKDLSERMDGGRFLTLFLCLLGPDGEVRTLNAGHPPAFLYRRAEDACRLLDGNGPALGMLDDEVYTAGETFRLDVGDALFLYSDGATEARKLDDRDEFLGEDRLRALFESCMRDGMHADETATHLAEKILEFSGGLNDDDLTLAVVRREA